MSKIFLVAKYSQYFPSYFNYMEIVWSVSKYYKYLRYIHIFPLYMVTFTSFMLTFLFAAPSHNLRIYAFFC